MLLPDEATPFAREGVVNGERLAASATRGKARGGKAETKKEAATELLWGEVGSIEGAGHGRKPSAGHTGSCESPGGGGGPCTGGVPTATCCGGKAAPLLVLSTPSDVLEKIVHVKGRVVVSEGVGELLHYVRGGGEGEVHRLGWVEDAEAALP